MDISIPRFERFIYSQHFYSGVRRATGILLPVMVFGGIFGLYAEGLIATFGALCVALIDQPGPHEHRGVEMLGGTLLSTLTVVTTGLTTSHPILIWFVVIGQCFAFSMLSVYGKKGSQIGFACLLVMTITLHSPLTTDEVWHHALISFGGGLFYTVYSYSVSQAMNMREKAQSLSIALFATAQYIRRRADMYDLDNDLDEGYRKLIECQSAMTEQHQAARDMVLRGLSTAANQQDPRRVMLWNIFIDMLGILDSLVATHTDYALLRRELANSDALLFMRDALYKMSLDIDRIALAVSRNRAVCCHRHHSVRQPAGDGQRAIAHRGGTAVSVGTGERDNAAPDFHQTGVAGDISAKGGGGITCAHDQHAVACHQLSAGHAVEISELLRTGE